MDISLRDETGDPCEFDGICIVTECCGFGGQGFGDTYLRELIQSEAYLQNDFSTDPRIREITQGNLTLFILKISRMNILLFFQTLQLLSNGYFFLLCKLFNFFINFQHIIYRLFDFF